MISPVEDAGDTNGGEGNQSQATKAIEEKTTMAAQKGKGHRQGSSLKAAGIPLYGGGFGECVTQVSLTMGWGMVAIARLQLQGDE